MLAQKHIWIASELGDELLPAVREVVAAWQRKGWPIGLHTDQEIDVRVARRVRVVFLPGSALTAPGSGAWLAKYDVTPYTKRERILLNQNYRWMPRSPKWWDVVKGVFSPMPVDIRPVLAHEIAHAFHMGHSEDGSIADRWIAISAKWNPSNIPTYAAE